MGSELQAKVEAIERKGIRQFQLAVSDLYAKAELLPGAGFFLIFCLFFDNCVEEAVFLARLNLNIVLFKSGTAGFDSGGLRCAFDRERQPPDLVRACRKRKILLGRAL